MSNMYRNIKPRYSRTQVNNAGKKVRLGTATEEDIEVIENWRAAHNKILNDWQAALRTRCKNHEIYFVQRLKREPTIYNKLKREPTMQLSNMHDIAGCRLIFKDVESIHKFRERLHKSKTIKHLRHKGDAVPYPYDYIQNIHPDHSGYRAIHDIYKYQARGDKDKSWNLLQVEIQYRTQAQNSWATANEIAGHITGNRSKFGFGDERQKEFFRLSSEIIARTQENLTSCYPNLENHELVKKFKSIDDDIRLLVSLGNVKKASFKYDLSKRSVVLIYSLEDRSLLAKSFKNFHEAQIFYFEQEKLYGDKKDIVLVRSLDKKSLSTAYKNYFSDTVDFIKLVNEGLKILSEK